MYNMNNNLYLKSNYQRESNTLLNELEQSQNVGINESNSDEFNKKLNRLQWLKERINHLK